MIPTVSGARVYALNVHADYACRHSGACCTAGWNIPVEPANVALLGGEWLLPDASGACPKHDRAAHRCRVHRDHGEAALPDSCRHFPRRSLIDPRGTFVSLSHFCPTAASLLLDSDAPLAIVDTPAAFPQDRTYDGLDARQGWPPLLRPDVLFDFQSFDLWEQFLVATLGSPVGDVSTALITIADAAERLRDWPVERGPLVEWTASALNPSLASAPVRALATSDATMTHDAADAAWRYERLNRADAFQAVCGTVPHGLSAPELPEHLDEWDAAWVASQWSGHSRAVRRFLCAKAFGSWTSYQSRGIRTQVAELFVAATILRVECVRACARAGRSLDRETLLDAVRMTDWLLVHLVDREHLMTWLGRAEIDEHAFSRA
jgi:hypothetical protein